MNSQAQIDHLQSLINSSSLGTDDKMLLTDRLTLLSPEVLQLLITTLELDPHSIEKIVKFTKLKINAQNNPDKIPEIIALEREEIENAIKQSEINNQI